MVSTFRSVTRSFGSWLFAGGVVFVGAGSCGAPDEHRVDPERAFVETPSGRRVAIASRAVMRPAALRVPDDRFVIAKFEGAISNEARAALAAAGFREVGYMPYDALLLERPASGVKGNQAAESAASLPGMAAWVPYRAEDRVSRELLPEELAARSSADPVPVMIHVMPGHDRAAARAAAVARGGEVAGEGQSGPFGRITVLFPADKAADAVQVLSQQSEIFFLERIHRVGWLNDKTAGTIQSGTQGHAAAQTPIWEHGIRGEGQIVGVIDTGIDANSCYFGGTSLPIVNTWSQGGGYGTMTDPSHRKIVAYDFLYSCEQYPNGTPPCETPSDHTSWDTQGHGSHVSGNMVGDSDNNPATYAAQDGMAPAAKIVVQDGGYGFNTCAECPGLGCPVISLLPLFEQSRLQGASVHNNSWGDNEEARPPYLQSNYTERSQDVDRYMWEHRDFLIVFAAGNYGAGNVEFSIGSPSTNKNGLCIGSTRTGNASTSDENMSGFSSRGWSSDGRIKPDLMAPGYNTSAGNNNSVDAPVNCGTSGGGGTSYAAPIAVGAATLVRQYFMDGFYPTGAKTAGNALTPTAALLKAMLINSAASMTGTDNAGQAITPIPSNEQGWGRIRLDQALFFTGGERKLYVDDHRQGMPAGATTPFTYTVNSVAASQPLKVTLTYTDYPGMPDSPPSALPSVTDSATWGAARLVNDIDLTVTGPSGTYLGNVFTNGASATGGASDKRNNVEQVLLATPMAGTYTITVTPTTIVQANQDFALVVTGAFQSVSGPPGGTDAGVDAPSPDVMPPPTQDATIDQEASTPPDAPPITDVTPRPDGTGGASGAAGAAGASGSGGTAGGGAAGTAGTAGRGGTAGTAGASGSGGASGGPADAGTTPDASRPDGGGGTGGSTMPPTTTTVMPPPPSDSGCDCSIPRQESSSRAGLLGLGLAVALATRRRRR
ncbi:MAG TPA: S8 family serine peptidase [Polyangiaceae bacterium]|nr:S8 family serine peptidase [Polyangiaceae bacterium]